MNSIPKYHQIEVDGISVEVVRKAVRNLNIRVSPPEGRVRVAAPARMSMDAIRLSVVDRLVWIRKHQARFAGLVRQPPRQYVTGETHFYQGRSYLLQVIPHKGRPRIVTGPGAALEMHVREDSDADYRGRVLSGWYRQRLKEQVPALIEKWEGIMGVDVAEWRVKQMKTKWGTCNVRARRVWLNLELAKKAPHALEYIVVHELAHLLERSHNDRFKGLMDSFLPHWRHYRDELNKAPLGHEDWEE